MPAGRRTLFSRAHDYRQYSRTPHDGPPAGHVYAGGFPLVAGLGMAAWTGGNAAVGTVNQRV